MDEKDLKPTEPARNISVMDVQPPKPSEQPVAAAPQLDAPSVEDALNDTDPTAAEETTQEPVTESPESTDTVDSTAESTPVDSENPMAVTPANAGPAKHKAPVAAVIAAIVIALVLAGATIFAYLKTKDQAATTTPQKTATPAVAATPVSAAEVQQTSTELDDSLKAIDENKDFANTDLDDTTLGL